MKLLICLFATLIFSPIAFSNCEYANSQLMKCLNTTSKEVCQKALLGSYTGDLYRHMNATLRGFNSNRDCVDTAQYLTEVLLSLPATKATVYRGMQMLPELQKLKVHGCFSDKAFVSTSLSKEVGEDFADRALSMSFLEKGPGAASDSAVLMAIKTSSARDVSPYSSVKGESEMILLPNTWLKLIKKTSTDDYTRLDFEEVNQDLCDGTYRVSKQ